MDDDERAVAWYEIERLAEEVRPRLPEDFIRTVLDGAMQVARDAKNPLRGNLFASAMREVIGMTLSATSPEADVLSCSWLKVAEAHEGKPTRSQRLSYWVRGGLEDHYLAETLRLDLNELTSGLSKAFKELNRAVHVREETQVHDEEEVIALVTSALKTVHNAILEADNCRLSVIGALIEEIEDEATEAFIRETIGAIDELATHHWIEAVEVNDAAVTP